MRDAPRFISVDGRCCRIRREYATNPGKISLLSSTKRWTTSAPRHGQDKQANKSE
jgi:hypothetical protein